MTTNTTSLNPQDGKNQASDGDYFSSFLTNFVEDVNQKVASMLADKMAVLRDYSYETHIIVEQQVENAQKEYIALAEKQKSIDTMLRQFQQETGPL